MEGKVNEDGRKNCSPKVVKPLSLQKKIKFQILEQNLPPGDRMNKSVAGGGPGDWRLNSK